METTAKKITVEASVNAPVEKVWAYWAEPRHIMQWCNASDDWHAPHAENDLRTGGKFTTTMAAKDGSMSFDFGGEYTHVVPNNFIAYTMGDGRKVTITFTPQGDQTHISETFDIENQNPEEMQRGGWQAILDNFAKYTETN
jgi:uncharacterized protein YndB with AHSA1/START domain